MRGNQHDLGNAPVPNTQPEDGHGKTVNEAKLRDIVQNTWAGHFMAGHGRQKKANEGRRAETQLLTNEDNAGRTSTLNP